MRKAAQKCFKMLKKIKLWPFFWGPHLISRIDSGWKDQAHRSEEKIKHTGVSLPRPIKRYSALKVSPNFKAKIGFHPPTLSKFYEEEIQTKNSAWQCAAKFSLAQKILIYYWQW